MRVAGPLLVGILLAGAASMAACGDPGDDAAGDGTESSDDDGSICIPGQSIACECPNGSQGAQSCLDDGSGYDECICDGSSGSADTTDTDDPTNASNSDPTDPSDESDSGESGAAGFDCETDTPSFQDDVVPIFYDSCGAGVAGCHDRKVFNASFDEDCRGWVALEDNPIGSTYYSGPNMGDPTGCPDMPLYDRLVNLVPWHCEANDYESVVPGDPDNSYIMRKINGGPFCGMDKVMPPPNTPFEISPDETELVRCWIEQGALNN